MNDKRKGKKRRLIKHNYINKGKKEGRKRGKVKGERKSRDGGRSVLWE